MKIHPLVIIVPSLIVLMILLHIMYKQKTSQIALVQPGTYWCEPVSDYDKANPFHDSPRNCVKVEAVSKGWVRYGPVGIPYWSLPVGDFLNQYPEQIPDPYAKYKEPTKQ